MDVAPDWICEILSPSTKGIDRGGKRRLYATYGVSHLWYLHPVERYLEVLILRDGQWVIHDTFDGAAELRAPPFDAVTFRCGDLWPIPPAEKSI